MLHHRYSCVRNDIYHSLKIHNFWQSLFQGRIISICFKDSDDEEGSGPGKVPCSVDVLAEWYAEKQQVCIPPLPGQG